ncbi:MAG: insulinase family protein [Bacteroidota bacterium]
MCTSSLSASLSRSYVLAVALAFGAGCAPAVVVTDAEAPAEEPTLVAGPLLAPPVTEAPGTPLPMRPDLLADTLDNGLAYYVLRNAEPQDRAELRLVVNAGSILEADDQQGLAHFLEHMAFNGTAQFERQELVDYLEGIGMRFGPDLNAYTSFDETVYLLQVPTDSTEIVETAFDILREWASAITLDPAEIDKERGVILEEERLGKGAQDRIQRQQLPVLFNGSRYADRLPIGTSDVIQNAPYEAIERFYADWYRPDLMAIVAVGDFDPAEIEAEIIERFAPLTNPDDAPERVGYGVPDGTEPQFAVASDPEATASVVGVLYGRTVQPAGTDSTFRRDLIAALYNQMLNDRLREIVRQPDAPFVAAFSFEGGFVRTRELYGLQAIVPEGGIEMGLRALLTEAARVRQHGFTATELTRAKTELRRAYEQAAREADKQESGRIAGALVSLALGGGPVVDPATEFLFADNLLPGIALAEVNAKAETLMPERNRSVLVSAPETEGVALPDEAALAAVFAVVDALSVAPYEDGAASEPLLPTLPEPGAIATRTRYPALDYAEFTLDNGVRVVHKQTDFQNDQVLVRAFSPGGTGLVDDSTYLAVRSAVAFVSQSGVGAFSVTDLEKKLAGQVVGVAPYISEREEGFQGSASPDDLETLFQLVHLYVTAPRLDADAVTSLTQRIRASIANRANSPQAAFADTLSVTLQQAHSRRLPFDEAALDALDPQASFSFYRDRFADLDDFTFVVVGNVDLDTLQPLATRYLGSLPTLPRTDSLVVIETPPPPGVVEKTVVRGVESQSRVALVYTGFFDEDDPEARRAAVLQFDTMGKVLNTRLREELREERGGVYGVGVSTSADRETGEYALQIGFGCDPTRVDELVAAVQAEVAALRAAPPAATYLQRVQEQARRQREENLRDNGYWLSVLENAYRYDESPEQLLGSVERLHALTVGDIQATARRFVNPDQVVRVVLVPEATSEEASGRE